MKSLKYSWLEISKGLPVVWGVKVQKSLICFFLFFDSSRLGCQICVTKDFKGITLTIPKAHRDVRDL